MITAPQGGAKELALRVWRTRGPELSTELTLISWFISLYSDLNWWE
jgi:hypothetical protein